MKRILAILSIIVAMLCVAALAFAAEVEIPADQFFNKVVESVKQFGGLSGTMKVASILTIVLSSTKVTFLRQLIWDRLPLPKVFIAPLLSVIIGTLSLSMEGALTLPGVMTWLFAGAGAVLLHEFLDGFKELPWIGKPLKSIIDIIMGLLGAQKAKPQSAPVQPGQG